MAGNSPVRGIQPGSPHQFRPDRICPSGLRSPGLSRPSTPFCDEKPHASGPCAHSLYQTSGPVALVADQWPGLDSVLAVALVAHCVNRESGSTDTRTVARRPPAMAVTVVSPAETPMIVPSAFPTVAI